MDPISNLLCTLQNGRRANKTYVSVPYSKVVWAIVHVLHVHGYINGMGLQTHGRQKRILIVFLPHGHTFYLTRASSPKKRVYLPVHKLRTTMHSFNIRILSTPKGIMADQDALKANVGGEILCLCA
jgi:small subunit ribosomal protein S8|tara:strand:- start:1244 stop:1621 length:378 start_codon:yes stop_codon:yes gene_type:complete